MKKEKYVVSKRFFRTLNNKVNKYMTLISKISSLMI